VQNLAAVISGMMGKACRFTDFHETKIGKPKLLLLACEQCVLAIERTPIATHSVMRLG